MFQGLCQTLNKKLGHNGPSWANFKYTGQDYMFKGAVFIFGTFAKEATETMFYKRGYEIVDHLDLADIVVLLGGADITPGIYGEKPAGAIGFNEKADKIDMDIIQKASKHFKVGICRGAQLLNCYPNNGKLWQDIDKHEYGDHSVTDFVTSKSYIVNSLHHQQMVPGPKGEVIAGTNLARVKEGWNKKWHVDGTNSPDLDVEAVFYPDTKSLCVQWHPEFLNADSEPYFFELLDRYFQAA